MEFFEKKNNRILWGVLICIMILILALGIFFYFFRKNKVSYTTLKSNNEKFSIQVPISIGLVRIEETNDFSMDFYSPEKDLYLYATIIEKVRNISLYDAIKNDKDLYLKDKENIREDSDIYESNIGNHAAYEYHFLYSDTSYEKDFYSHIVWIETENFIYVLNFEVPSDVCNEYLDIWSNIKNSFVEL